LLAQVVLALGGQRRLARIKAGNSKLARRAMMAVTTSSSIRVNPVVGAIAL
jgi:hypothetical protein